MLGDKVVKGIDGWIEVTKRIKKIITNSDKVYFDNDAATLLAIDYISKKIKIQSIEKISEEIIHLQDLSLMLTDRSPKGFISKPFNVYIHTYKVNSDAVKIIAIKSNGEIKEFYSFQDLWGPNIPF